MPVILYTWETEIRRIVGQGQPGQIVLETLSRKYPTQGADGVAQVVKCLLSKCDSSSNPSNHSPPEKELNMNK
jgi:hypothetical protein